MLSAGARFLFWWIRRGRPSSFSPPAPAPAPSGGSESMQWSDGSAMEWPGGTAMEWPR